MPIYLRLRYFLYVLFILSLCATNQVAFADSEIIYHGPNRPISEIEQNFQLVIEKIRSGELGRAGEMLEQLRLRAQDFGYRELPSISLRLLELVPKIAEQEGATHASYIIRQAVNLSSTDPRVLFKAATYYEFHGIQLSATYFIGGVASSLSAPSIVFSFFINLFLLVLSAATLSLFIVIVVQLAKKIPNILAGTASLLQGVGGGLFSPILVLILLLGPIYFGIASCLLTWSLMLALAERKARNIFIASVLIFISWGLILPISEAVKNQLDYKAGVILEDVYHARYSAPDITSLVVASRSMSYKATPTYLLGVELIRRGAILEGRKLLDLALSNAETANDVNLVLASLNELARIEMKNNDHVRAHELLEQAVKKKSDSFEILYNLSLIYILKLDTEKHREHLNKAKEVSATKWARHTPINDIQSQYLTINPSLSASYQFYFMPAPYISKSYLATRNLHRVGLERLLLNTSFGSAVIVFLGLISAILYFVLPVAKTASYFATAETTKPALIWLVIPGGVLFAGHKPLKGFCLLTLFFIFVMIFIGEPAVFNVNLFDEKLIRIIFGSFAAVLFFFSFLFGIRSFREAR